MKAKKHTPKFKLLRVNGFVKRVTPAYYKKHMAMIERQTKANQSKSNRRKANKH